MSDSAVAEPEAPAADDAAAEGEKPEKGARKKRTPLSDLAVGQELAGRVRTIKDFGVFVDIGAESDGLVHISQMSAAFVSNPADIANIGDSVTVRVLTVDTDKKQIGLTMKTEAESAAEKTGKRGGRREAAPRKRDDDDEAEEEDDGETTSELDAAPAGEKDVSAFENFDMTKFLNGEVVATQSYGAFVRLEGTDIDGLLPNGDMLGKLKVGQKIEVRITDVDVDRKRLTLTNTPVMRGRKTRFAAVKGQGDEDELTTLARKSGLYASELPDDFEMYDDDADWEAAFAFGVEESTEETNDDSNDGEEDEDGLSGMGSINRFRSPAWRRERGLISEEEAEAAAGVKYAGEDAPDLFTGDGEDTSAAAAYFKQYDSQIPQLGDEEIKALIKKAQGTRRNVEEEWAEEEAQEREYLAVSMRATSKKGDYSMLMKGVSPMTADEANKKPRVPIYFSKKLSKIKQVELLEELEKLSVEDPMNLVRS